MQPDARATNSILKEYRRKKIRKTNLIWVQPLITCGCSKVHNDEGDYSSLMNKSKKPNTQEVTWKME